jgi:hypothetical protein
MSQGLGASNHSRTGVRELNDFYATPKHCVEDLLEREELNVNVIECSVGTGNIANVLKDKGYNVEAYDLIDRGYPGVIVADYLNVFIEKRSKIM